jgi:hypothetical protein
LCAGVTQENDEEKIPFCYDKFEHDEVAVSLLAFDDDEDEEVKKVHPPQQGGKGKGFSRQLPILRPASLDYDPLYSQHTHQFAEDTFMLARDEQAGNRPLNTLATKVLGWYEANITILPRSTPEMIEAQGALGTHHGDHGQKFSGFEHGGLHNPNSVLNTANFPVNLGKK